MSVLAGYRNYPTHPARVIIVAVLYIIRYILCQVKNALQRSRGRLLWLQAPMIRLPPSPTHDPWSSFEDEPNQSHQALAGPSRSRNRSYSPSSLSSSPTQHPLHTTEKVDDIDSRLGNGRYPGLNDLSDVSRPALRRLTSETERQVAESSRSGSERGSLDMLRMSVADPGAEEVEVLIHHVRASRALSKRGTAEEKQGGNTHDHRSSMASP